MKRLCDAIFRNLGFGTGQITQINPDGNKLQEATFSHIVSVYHINKIHNSKE